VSDLKINLPDTFVSCVLVTLSLTAVFFLGLLQVIQAIWGKRIEEKIAYGPQSLRGQNIWYKVHEHQPMSKA